MREEEESCCYIPQPFCDILKWELAWDEWEPCSLAEMLKQASAGCRSCCGGKPGLTRSLNPLVPIHRLYLVAVMCIFPIHCP